MAVSRKSLPIQKEVPQSFSARLELRQRKFRLFVVTMFVYSFLALIAMVFLVNKDLLLFPFVDTKSVEQLKKEIVKLKTDSESVHQSLEEISKSLASDPRDKDLIKISAQIQDIRSRQQAIDQTINVDGEKALTATLIREKQKDIDANIVDVRAGQNRLNDKVDQFISTLISVPLIGFVLALLSYVIIYFFFRSKDKKPTNTEVGVDEIV
jgi:hypothetical protein